ncbi:hypothetical protein EDB87DRAFT_1573684 [Lactarius vividus]|nr:hypothetical protein EDB87DRAFT_1573684 [Lactarius vividus]
MVLLLVVLKSGFRRERECNRPVELDPQYTACSATCTKAQAQRQVSVRIASTFENNMQKVALAGRNIAESVEQTTAVRSSQLDNPSSSFLDRLSLSTNFALKHRENVPRKLAGLEMCHERTQSFSHTPSRQRWRRTRTVPFDAKNEIDKTFRTFRVQCNLPIVDNQISEIEGRPADNTTTSFYASFYNFWNNIVTTRDPRKQVRAVRPATGLRLALVPTTLGDSGYFRQNFPSSKSRTAAVVRYKNDSTSLIRLQEESK